MMAAMTLEHRTLQPKTSPFPQVIANAERTMHGIEITGEIEIKVYSPDWELINTHKQKNLTVNTALNALATAVQNNSNPFVTTPTIKMGTSATAASASQTDLIAAVVDTNELLARIKSGYSTKTTYLFSPTVARDYAETGIFFGSTMWARVVLSPIVSVPANGFHIHSWTINFAAG
jgi:hypothetical protein